MVAPVAQKPIVVMADINKIKVGQQVVLTIGTTDRIEGDYFGNVCGINKERTLVHVRTFNFDSYSLLDVFWLIACFRFS